jgi:hypothetical protein
MLAEVYVVWFFSSTILNGHYIHGHGESSPTLVFVLSIEMDHLVCHFIDS